MNEVTLLLSAYGAVGYLIGGFMLFAAKAHRWRNPWADDKAFALAVLWPVCAIYVVCRSLICGIVKLVQDEVL